MKKKTLPESPPPTVRYSEKKKKEQINLEEIIPQWVCPRKSKKSFVRLNKKYENNDILLCRHVKSRFAKGTKLMAWHLGHAHIFEH
jgi:hypothetical protein